MPAICNDATEGLQWQRHESIDNDAIDAFQDTFGSSKDIIPHPTLLLHLIVYPCPTTLCLDLFTDLYI
ncbi:hypothetical protein ACHAWO_012361 [Cyclotella atomus]|uniref:Uncharacterized protein n=1 Tax=Cyclotella atomus TaxID=382360 RepID=A0ABD3Q4F1_9STRA